MSYDRDGLYRRSYRNGSVQIKTEFGWKDVAEELWWKFRPTLEACRCVRMPDHSFLCYGNSERDRLGERDFSLWIESQRRLVLEKKLRERYQKEMKK